MNELASARTEQSTRCAETLRRSNSCKQLQEALRRGIPLTTLRSQQFAEVSTRTPSGFPLSWSRALATQAQDFIDVLVSPTPNDRYCGRGAGLEPLRQHMWFNDTNWEAIGNGEDEAPHAHLVQVDRRPKH